MSIKWKFKSDCNGCPLKIGDEVRVCAIPNLRGMSKQTLEESKPVFRYAVGKTFTINQLDNYGCASIDFFIPFGNHKGWHALYIETYLLKKIKNVTKPHNYE